MSARHARARGLKAIAAIRGLSARTAELAAARAEGNRRDAERRHEDCAAALDEIQAGWSRALAGGAFDPDVVRHWFTAAADKGDEARRLAGDLADAEDVLRERRADAHAAAARSDAAGAQAAAAAKGVRRWREEQNLAAAEDRSARRGHGG